MGVTPTWLSTGKGDKYPHIYGLKNENKQHSNIKEDFINNKHKENLVPLISWVSAGIWCDAIDNYSPGDAEEWLPCPTKCGKNTYALKVSGDSMTANMAGSKTYPNGCIVYVDPELQVTNGKRVIAKLIDKNEVTFKTYKEDAGKKWLMPINTQYENILIDENVIICGVIIAKYEQE